MAKGQPINITIRGDYDSKDVDRAIRDLQKLQGQASPAAKSVGGLTTAFKGMALAAGAFVGLSAVKDFIGDAVNQGSALEESLSKVNVVFGDSAKEIVSWSETSATAFGQSQAQALESVGTFGNLLQAFGSTADEAQVMSRRMVELAADLASFNNTSVEDALQAIQSGLSGEAEPLKRYGAALTDVRLKAVAMEKGLYSGKGALDVHAKSVAAYELILKDTALAQGDFARTSDGFANQTRIMQAAIDDLKAKFGVGIIEGFQQGATSGQGLASSFDSMEESASDLGKTLGYLAGEALGAAGDMAQATASVIGYKEALDDSQGEAEGLGLTIERWFASIFLWATSAEVPLKKFSTTAKNTGGIAKEATGPVDEFGQQLSEADIAAQSAEDALKALKDAVGALDDKMSNIASREDYRRYLRDLEGDLEELKNKTLGLGPASDKARDALIDAFSKASEAATDWAERTGASPEQLADKFATEGRKIVQRFVDAGFKRSDVKKFLKDQGLWVSELSSVGDYAKAAGVNIGKDLISGITGALSDPNNLATLRYAAMQAAEIPEQEFRRVTETQSPSRAMARVGKDVVQGLIEGMASKKEALAEQSRVNADAIIAAAEAKLTQWDATIDAYKSRYDELASYASGITSNILGQFNLGTAVEEARESGKSIVDVINEQAGGIGTFAQNMISLLETNLSRPAWEAVAALSAEQGAYVSEQMLGAQGQTIIDGINQTYAAVDHMATAVGLMATKKWYDEGVSEAQATYEGFKANFGEGGPARKALMNLMDRLANSMNRTATITVTTINRVINEAVPGGVPAKTVVGATGGIVNRPTFALIGEAGPEAVIPLDRTAGNDPLPMVRGGSSGKTVINLSINAGMGTDGAEVGRQIVEALKSYSRRNGPLPLAVA